MNGLYVFIIIYMNKHQVFFFNLCLYTLQALDTLLELSASSNDKFGSSSKHSSCDTSFLLEGYNNALANCITRKCQAGSPLF